MPVFAGWSAPRTRAVSACNKVDLATTDCICLTFEFNNGMAPLQVSEEWAGFAELFGPLAAAFPTIPPEWYAEVMTPAFKAYLLCGSARMLTELNANLT